MNRHEESSSAGITVAIVIGLILCLLIVGGSGVVGFLYMQQRSRIAYMQAEVEADRLMLESQLAASAQPAAGGTRQLIKIEFDTSGMYLVDGESLTGEELQTYLTAKAAANPGNIAVELLPTDDTAYVLVSGVTAMCEQAGVKEVSVGKVEKSDD